MKAQDIELLAGISLSDGGISLPLHTVLRKRPFRITMKTPTTRSLIRISKRYLRIGVTPEEYDAYDQTSVSGLSSCMERTSAVLWHTEL
jgi:hypothetical protein